MGQQVRTAGLAGAVFAVDGAFLLVFLVALPVYLVDDLGARESMASFTFAAFGASRLVFQLGGGAVADRLGAGRAAAGPIVFQRRTRPTLASARACTASTRRKPSESRWSKEPSASIELSLL